MMVQDLIPDYHEEVMAYCQRVVTAFSPVCIILHGSYARGTYHPMSDVDLIVISDELPERFLRRFFVLNKLKRGQVPLEVIGYTSDEWEKMMTDKHLTVLEALHWGKPLHGKAIFEKWQAEMSLWKTQGLRRDVQSWVLPKVLAG